uniref:Saposin B-type domain-containing protein n=1 Tax=Chelydra serpentina TaxID=8475 RepID=A0A8C3S7T5_CHESE
MGGRGLRDGRRTGPWGQGAQGDGRRAQGDPTLGLCLAQQGWHVQKEAISIKCRICTSILKKLQSMVGDDPDEDSIVEAEDKLCGVVGRSLRRLCLYVMKKFKPKITEALQDGQDPKEICTSLRMCRASPPTQGFPTCSLCRGARGEERVGIKPGSLPGVGGTSRYQNWCHWQLASWLHLYTAEQPWGGSK